MDWWTQFWSYWGTAATWTWPRLGLLGGSGAVMSGVLTWVHNLVRRRAGHHPPKEVWDHFKTWLVAFCIVFFLLTLIGAPPGLDAEQRQIINGLSLYTSRLDLSLGALQSKFDAVLVPHLRSEVVGGFNSVPPADTKDGSTLGFFYLAIANSGAPSVVQTIHVDFINAAGVSCKCKLVSFPRAEYMTAKMVDGYRMRIPESDNLVDQTVTTPIPTNGRVMGWLMITTKPVLNFLPIDPSGCHLKVHLFDAQGAEAITRYDIGGDIKPGLPYANGIHYYSEKAAKALTP